MLQEGKEASSSREGEQRAGWLLVLECKQDRGRVVGFDLLDHVREEAYEVREERERGRERAF